MIPDMKNGKKSLSLKEHGARGKHDESQGLFQLPGRHVGYQI
jgi:hypothetical protein